jgi:hypothetical protein
VILSEWSKSVVLDKIIKTKDRRTSIRKKISETQKNKIKRIYWIKNTMYKCTTKLIQRGTY